ncbi:hypothetical protein OSTOST_22724 [Ostertagia ostertagi]
MMGVAVALLLCTVYHVLLFIFSLLSDNIPVLRMRREVYPLLICFMSYVRTWLMLLTTPELRKKLLSLYGLKTKCAPTNSFVISQLEYTHSPYVSLRIKPIGKQLKI